MSTELLRYYGNATNSLLHNRNYYVTMEMPSRCIGHATKKTQHATIFTFQLIEMYYDTFSVIKRPKLDINYRMPK
jgi:hypothetical protein